MNVLIFHPQEFEFHYNCSGYSIESIPLEIRRHTVDAICLILIFMNLEIIYILCLYAISRPRNFKASSYRLMFCLGVVEMAGISITGLVSGVFNFLGVTYCSNPAINLFFGSAATGIWYFEAQISVVLAFNRCLSITSTYSSRALFHGKRFYLWILIPLTIAFLLLWYTPPVVYSSVGGGFFFNPHVGYSQQPDAYFTNIIHFYFNQSIAFSLTIIYVIFGLFFCRQKRLSAVHSEQKKIKDFRLFLQISIICFLAMISAVGYAYESYFEEIPILVKITAYAYVIYQGSPAMVYLLLNKTIQKEIQVLLRLDTKNQKFCSTTDINASKHSQNFREPNASSTF